MDPRLLKGFVRWMMNVEWDGWGGIREMIYPNDAAPYHAEKQSHWMRDPWGWFLTLDPANVAKVAKRVEEIYGNE